MRAPSIRSSRRWLSSGAAENWTRWELATPGGIMRRVVLAARGSNVRFRSRSRLAWGRERLHDRPLSTLV